VVIPYPWYTSTCRPGRSPIVPSADRNIPQLGVMPSNALPPLIALTPTDHGAIVVVVAWCFAGFTMVAAVARTAITVIKKQGFHRDDVGYFSGAVSILPDD
jgi:hypothetical protein